MRKHRKRATLAGSAGKLRPGFSDNPVYADPDEAIDQELLGIWMSISRLRQIIRSRPAIASSHSFVLLRQNAPEKPAPKKAMHKKPRRKAA